MIGLTLEGGGTRGSYQVGAYQAFKKCHIKFDGISGTSIGSFNAAMLAAHQEKELLDFWQSADFSKLLKLEGFKDLSIRTLNKTFSNIKDILKNKGIDTSVICETLNNILDEESLYKSKTDFGLVTVKLKTLEPIYKYKSEIPKSKITEYIIASCCLPVFKMEKRIDDDFYIDGGFYDNSPVNLWIKKGYKKIYVVCLNGPGFKAKYDKSCDITFIKPSRRLGSILSLNQDKINDNIRLGYFDTLKVLKHLDGKKYIFKKHGIKYYEFINRKISESTKRKLFTLYKVDNVKDLTIKVLEYLMNENEFTYYKVYSPMKVIKELKKKNNKKLNVYKYVNKLKFLR